MHSLAAAKASAAAETAATPAATAEASAATATAATPAAASAAPAASAGGELHGRYGVAGFTCRRRASRRGAWCRRGSKDGLGKVRRHEGCAYCDSPAARSKHESLHPQCLLFKTHSGRALNIDMFRALISALIQIKERHSGGAAFHDNKVWVRKAA